LRSKNGFAPDANGFCDRIKALQAVQGFFCDSQGPSKTPRQKLPMGTQGRCAQRKIFKIKVLRVMMRMVILGSLVFYNNRFVKEKQVKNWGASPFASPPLPWTFQ
jgi:hypothetical protein